MDSTFFSRSPISFDEACRNTFLLVRDLRSRINSEYYRNLNANTLPDVVPQKIASALTNISTRNLHTKFRMVPDPAGRCGVLKTDLIRWFGDIKIISNLPSDIRFHYLLLYKSNMNHDEKQGNS